MNKVLSPVVPLIFCIICAGSGASAIFRPTDAVIQTPQSAVVLNWLDGSAPLARQGVSFGVPWPKGAMRKNTPLALTTADGRSVPVQTWPLAYWPDGSLKWTGQAISATPDLSGPLTLAPGNQAAPPIPIRATQSADGIEIDTGAMQCRIPVRGPTFLTSLVAGGREVGRDGRLVLLREDRTEYESGGVLREEQFAGQIGKVTLEQSGPVRAVVKIEGAHRIAKATKDGRVWLPFTLRLYFFAGLDSARLVHSFVFDGDQEQDFIKGLGVRFSVPMREQAHNRHLRLTGETGLLAEPLRLLATRNNSFQDLYARQIAGRPIPNLDQLANRSLVEKMAVWDGFKLTQLSADSFIVQKRTGAHSSWIQAAAGGRSSGTVFIGDTSGGLAVGMKNFWQLAPTGLEVEKASTAAAELTLWLWSPDVPAMDLRHYSDREHGLDASYEDLTPGFNTATGVARTSELTLQAFTETPANNQLLRQAQVTARTPYLVCTPEYYHSIPVFGVWSLPDRSTQGKRLVEEQLDRALAFYQGQVEQRRWYGFWDYGDVMHSYDSTRHTWRYDVGGYAWANTELMPDLWLWYSFLRTGRADVFRMAEAMTRHTQEVDVYHAGKLAGLGSRHNVRHWGDGAKEVRISQALLKRFYYYLAADERTGDLMDEVVNADYKLVEVDPLRKIEPKTRYPTHARVGPDWFALCSNWLAAWERTGDTKYRDKIVIGMKNVAGMPHRLFSGSSFGYDPQTSRLYQIHDNVDVPHLAPLMGGPELNFELAPLINLPEWNDAWLHYCEWLTAPPEEQQAALGAPVNTSRGYYYARMAAYAAFVKNDPKLAARAWHDLLSVGGTGCGGRLFLSHRIAGADVPLPFDEIPGVSTNRAAQWSLNAIQLLELVGRYLPEEAIIKYSKC